MAQKDIIRRNKRIAEQVGLLLDFPGGEADDEWALELRLDIGDGKKFVNYLHTLKEINLSQLKGLAKVAEILELQLTHGYDLANPEDERLLELASSLKNIVPEYKRIAGLNPSLETSATLLEEVYKSVKDGCLKEYILVKDEHLLDLVGGRNFGPSKWHTDSSEKDYIKRWNQVIETLAFIAKNPKAKELYEKARNNLFASLEYAEKDMKERKSTLLNNKISRFIEVTRQKLQQVDI